MLRTHLREQHDRQYPCTFEDCYACFQNAHQLKRHMVKHTGIKPYICNLCEFSAALQPNFIKHMIRKHGHNKEEVRAKIDTYKNESLLSNDTSEELYQDAKAKAEANLR